MSIQQAWHDSSGDTRSLEVRWNETAARMRAAGLSPTVPISEPSLYQMRQQLQKLHPPPVNDPDRNAASHELSALLDRYRIAAFNIERLQRGGMESWANERIHRLLRDIPFEGWDRQLKRELPSNVDWTSTTQQIRARATTIIPIVLAAEEMRSKLEAALNAAKRTPVETLVWKIFERIERNEQRLSALAAACDERLDQIAGQIERISRSARYIRRAKQRSK
jgi:hypothetical protein